MVAPGDGDAELRDLVDPIPSELVFATLDETQGTAARALGFRVI